MASLNGAVDKLIGFSKTCVEFILYRFFIGGIYMMGRNDEYQSKLEFIDLNIFVPSNHILLQINEKIDFAFIYNKMEMYYSKLGRKSLDPVLLFKMLLIGYLYNVDSERELELFHFSF
jgi:transposase